MKIKITRNNLLNALNISSNALCSKTSLPILECFLIEAKNNKITITANNTEITIINSTEAEVIENGSVAINGRFLIEMIKGLPEKDITLSVNDSFLCKLSCEKEKKEEIKTEFQCKDSKEFPKTLSYSKENMIEITEYQLKKAIERTLITVAKENEERKELTGVYLNVKNDQLKMKSLDGFKLGIINQTLRQKQTKELTTIIPRQTLENISKIIKGDLNKDIKIYINEKNIVFETVNATLISNIIQKQFPPTSQIEKNEYKIKVIVNRISLLNSINLTKMFSSLDEKPVILDIKENKLNVKINSLIGSMEENININKTGEDISIAFYHKHLLPILNNIEDEEIKLYLNTSDYPIVIKDDNENYYYLILPVTIK